MVESSSKTPLTRGQLDAIVERAFGGSVVLDDSHECVEGWFNAVHRLTLSDGTRTILKVAPPPEIRVLRYEHDLITTEVTALRLVRERTDLPVPAVLAWDDSCTIVASPWFVMEHCPGVLLSTVRPELGLDAQYGIDGELARQLASLHSITAEHFGRPDPSAPRFESWSAAFGALVDDLLADGTDAGVELPRPYEQIRAHVAGAQAALDEVTTPRLVHWDLWDLNVFVDPATLAVVGLIDFERVLWGDPLMEAQFAGLRTSGPIVDAYGASLFDASGARTRRLLYDLYLYLVMTIECAYRNYDSDGSEQFGRAMLDSVLAELDAP